jgi:hypothetical protein
MTKKTKRLIDIDGDVINEPKHYHAALEWGREMIDKMEEENVDRSDMQVILYRLYEEMRFTLVMLKSRGKNNV